LKSVYQRIRCAHRFIFHVKQQWIVDTMLCGVVQCSGHYKCIGVAKHGCGKSQWCCSSLPSAIQPFLAPVHSISLHSSDPQLCGLFLPLCTITKPALAEAQVWLLWRRTINAVITRFLTLSYVMMR